MPRAPTRLRRTTAGRGQSLRRAKATRSTRVERLTDVTADMTAQDYEATLIQTPQRKSLIALYNSTNGDGWTNKLGWKASPLYPDGFALPGTESRLARPDRRSGTQTVTAIDFTSNNLTGTLPAALGNLTSLTGLTLSGNLLTGSIPAGIGNLTGLTSLSLAGNQLTGRSRRSSAT